MTNKAEQFEGGCTCGAVRYRMESRPMFVHCCHCNWCRRETGSAFALNAMIEADRVTLQKGKPTLVKTPTNSGKGQNCFRCARCEIALWSTYAGAGDKVLFVRVGTLDEPQVMPPDIHIFAASKLPWVQIPHDTPSVEGYYNAHKFWPEDSLLRRANLNSDS
ncbi:MAG TPA: GFA family protein [Woeseiaceae bacterium]|nr:GFA family protein [Woeseiaceae bacterium]